MLISYTVVRRTDVARARFQEYQNLHHQNVAVELPTAYKQASLINRA